MSGMGRLHVKANNNLTDFELFCVFQNVELNGKVKSENATILLLGDSQLTYVKIMEKQF